jgi:hypothetical protein
MANRLLLGFLLLIGVSSLPLCAHKLNRIFFTVQPLNRSILAAASGAAAFRTGNTTAIHIGNTKSCIAGYGGPKDPDTSYKLCIPSLVAFTDNGTLFGQAALKHSAVSPGTAVSGFKRVIRLG